MINYNRQMTIKSIQITTLFAVTLMMTTMATTQAVFATGGFDTPVTLDNEGHVGFYTSIAIGTDGFPVISYHDGTNLDLKVVHCTNVDCSTTDTPVTLDNEGFVGQYTSIAIGTDGFPVISYFDGTNLDLKVVHCTSNDCTTADTPVTLDNEGNVGRFTSIAIGTDGFPVISYWDVTNGDLKVVHCTTVSCAIQPDTEAPIITLNGDNPVLLIENESYIEQGATATDNDPAFASDITIDDSEIDTSITGTYGVTYDVSDAANNAAIQVTRTVSVISPSDAIQELLVSELPTNIGNNLFAPLNQATKILDDNKLGNDEKSCSKISKFIDHVDNKESSGKMSSLDAEKFRNDATRIQNSLGC